MSKTTKSAHAIKKTINKLISSSSERRPRQKLQPIQAYSALHWQRLRSIVEPQWHAQLAVNPQLTNRDRLAFQNRLLADLYKQEPPSVHEEVEQYRQLQASAGRVEEQDQECDDGLPEGEKKRIQHALTTQE